MRTLNRVVLAVLLTGAIAAVSSAPGYAAPKADAADAVEPYERDVKVIVYSTLREPDATTDPSEPLFNDAGANLNVTWGEWTAATATSSMVTHGRHTNADLTFAGLIPGGTQVQDYLHRFARPQLQRRQFPGQRRFAI